MIRVYRNLHKNQWSMVRKAEGGPWHVYDHQDDLALMGVTFHVSEAGRQRVIAEQRKNVHAYAKGGLVGHAVSHKGAALLHATYNPYNGPHFTVAGKPISGARTAYFTPSGQVFVAKPVYI